MLQLPESMFLLEHTEVGLDHGEFGNTAHFPFGTCLHEIKGVHPPDKRDKDPSRIVRLCA